MRECNGRIVMLCGVTWNGSVRQRVEPFIGSGVEVIMGKVVEVSPVGYDSYE